MSATKQEKRASHSDRGVRSSSLPPPATGILLAIILLVFAFMYRDGHGNVLNVSNLFGVEDPKMIRDGQWWRLITPIFLHGGIPHVTVNCLSLYWLGGPMERIYGTRRYLIIFLFAGIAGNVLSYFLLPEPSLGASGALFGLVGAGLVFPMRYRSLMDERARKSILSQLIFVTVINLGFSFLPGIDKWAHFGGLLGGGFLALFLIPYVLDDRPINKNRELLLTVAAVSIVVFTIFSGWKQWRWAAAHPAIQETLLVYGPKGANPWFQFALPPNWRLLPNGKLPGDTFSDHAGDLLNVVDGSIYPGIPQRTERLLATLKTPVITTTVGGQKAYLASLKSVSHTTDICVLLPFHSILQISMSARNTSYNAAHADLLLMLKSFHFYHPPPAG